MTVDKSEPHPAYVKQADQDFVLVFSLDIPIGEKLTQLGFLRIGNNEFRLETNSEKEKALAFQELRELGLCFSRGKEWNPAEIFEYLRDKGLLTGPFTEIAWTGPGSWHTRTASAEPARSTRTLQI